jgi:hypothetical protein
MPAHLSRRSSRRVTVAAQSPRGAVPSPLVCHAKSPDGDAGAFNNLLACAGDACAWVNQAAAETFASVGTSEIVFRTCEAIW